MFVTTTTVVQNMVVGMIGHIVGYTNMFFDSCFLNNPTEERDVISAVRLTALKVHSFKGLQDPCLVNTNSLPLNLLQMHTKNSNIGPVEAF